MYVVLFQVRKPEDEFPKRIWVIEESKEKATQAITDAFMAFGGYHIEKVHVFDGKELDVKIDNRIEITF